jgi:hypothetical protein
MVSKRYVVSCIVTEDSVIIFLNWRSTSCFHFGNLLRVMDRKLLVWAETIIGLQGTQASKISVLQGQEVVLLHCICPVSVEANF